jgi:hypothetical protein
MSGYTSAWPTAARALSRAIVLTGEEILIYSLQPRLPRPAAKEMLVVVLPLPPFWEATAMRMMTLQSIESHNGYFSILGNTGIMHRRVSKKQVAHQGWVCLKSDPAGR